MASFQAKQICLLLAVFISGALADNLECKAGKHGLTRMQNRRVQNSFCLEHAGRTCCDTEDTNRLRKQYETLNQHSETSSQCLAVIQDALCSQCDPDMGLGVQDGLCIDYCDKLFSVCHEEYFDPYADKASAVPFCHHDSLLCSKINEQVTNGAEFCKLIGFPVSNLKEPTMRPDSDCFNGKSSVGVKYDRLEIDETLLTRDYSRHQNDNDDDFEDIDTRSGGDGFFNDFYNELIRPAYKSCRRFYRRHIGQFTNEVLALLACIVCFELFINRRLHEVLYDALCKQQKQRSRAPAAARDIARQERIRHIQERLNKKTQGQKEQKGGQQQQQQQNQSSPDSSNKQQQQNNKNNSKKQR